MLTLYHAEPIANSLKVLIALHEKGLAFESRYVDLHRFEQHEPWFVKLNPDGQVPVLDHDGRLITQTSVINEYLEDVFPDAPPLRPADPYDAARMRAWNKFIDEHVMNEVSMHGWHRMVAVIARSVESDEFETLMARIPLKEQRDKWRTARSGFPQDRLDDAERKIAVALGKVEAALAEGPWLIGEAYSLADVNFYAYCGVSVQRMFPHLSDARKHPRLTDWMARVQARPGVVAARAMPDHTNPALRTFSGEVR
jgi:glutathione S-transferase